MALTKVTGGVVSPTSDYTIRNVTGVAATFTGNVSVGGVLTYEDVTNIDSVGVITARSSIDAQGVISLAESIVHTGDTNTKISFPANDEISLDTSGHDRIYIKSDGKIGMGTVTPAVAIHHFSDGLNGNTLRLENREGYVSLTNDGDALHVDANSHHFRNKAGSSVFLVIGTSGQFGLGGTNYGTSGQVLTSQGSGSAVTWATPLNLNNATDNRVITSAGGATLNGESTLTYDGSTLQNLQSGAGANLTLKTTSNSFNTFILDSNRSADTQFGIIDGRWNGNVVNRIQFVTGSDGTNKDDGYMAFHTRESGQSLAERLRIGSEGNLALGGTNTAGYSNQSNFFIGGVGNIYADTGTGSGRSLSVSNNAYINAAGNWVYRSTDKASNIYQYNGITGFRYAASGTAGNTITWSEAFRINNDGKLLKGGNQIYPLVNYTEVTTFNNVSVSSSGYTDLRTVYSNYSPKKAGNRIVIHHQSQMWNGAAGNGNGDVFWRIMKDEGSGYSAFVTNERILGNHDGYSYTGGSGLARHHRTVHLMGSFVCNGNNFNLKTQGRSMGISWDWYHDSNNILQIWEYELN